MNDPRPNDHSFGQQGEKRLLDVLIRAGLILVLAMLCYRIFSPFLVLMVWAMILAITLYPLNEALAARLGGRKGWAATLISLLGIALIVGPTAVLVSSTGDSVQRMIDGVQQNTLQIPEPNAKVAAWLIVGERIFALSAMKCTPAKTIMRASVAAAFAERPSESPTRSATCCTSYRW